MESDLTVGKHSRCQVSAVASQENGVFEKPKLESIVSIEENDEDSRSTRKLSQESVDSSRTSISSSGGELTQNKLKPPKRVRIFQGGFRSNEDYTYIRGRGRGKYVCEECGIRCKKPSMLKKHIRTHTDLRPYKCSHCAFAFKTKGNLTKHMKSKAHHKKCMELGIVPVPTTIDYSQIDEGALSKQFSDADDDDDDELDDDCDDSDIDEDEEEDSQDQREEEEAYNSEWDADDQNCDSSQFEDASAERAALVTCMPDLGCPTDVMSVPAILENEIPLDQETEAARSLLDLSGLSRPLGNPDWIMASPSSQTRKSEGSLGSMECLSPAVGCIVSTASETLEDCSSEMSSSMGVLRMPWPAELSPKSRPRSYSVNVPPSRGGLRKSSAQTVQADHQTRVISFASSLPCVPEDQSEAATMTRRYSMSAVGDTRKVYMSSPLPSSSAYDRSPDHQHYQQQHFESQLCGSDTNLHSLSAKEEDTLNPNDMLNMPWVTLASGEQPMDLRVSKEPKDLFGRFPLAISPHLWKPGQQLPMTPVSEGKGYTVLPSPSSDMLSPERTNNVTDYFTSLNNSAGALSGGYLPNGEEGVSKGFKMNNDAMDNDLNVEMMEAPYSPEVVEFQPPLSPVSQNSLDNDSQSGLAQDDQCSASSTSLLNHHGAGLGLHHHGGEKMPSLVSASGCMTPMTTSQIEFHLSATVRSGGGINSTGGQMESEGKCSCSICNKTFSKPSQLRLHVNIHYFERPFRCDSCAVSFRTKGHLQKHKRSVSHYNKVNMNMTFGTPTTDNPRPFKCGDCKIAFRIHGHLAKHLRSKMHIMKLECLGKLPFGMYAEMERSGVNLNEIDTTDCENSLESLQVMAHRLYQLDPRRMRWHTADGLEPPPATGPIESTTTTATLTTTTAPPGNGEPDVTIRDVQSLKMSSPVTAQFSTALLSIPVSPVNTAATENCLASPPLRRTSIITSPPHQMSVGLSPTQNAAAYQRVGTISLSANCLSSSPVVSSRLDTDLIKCEPDEQSGGIKLNMNPVSVAEIPFTNSISRPTTIPVAKNHDTFAPPPKIAPLPTPTLTPTTIAPATSSDLTTNDTLLHRSCTCHLCGRLFKSAKFLQVHLYCDHPQLSEQQLSEPQWPVQTTVASAALNSNVNASSSSSVQGSIQPSRVEDSLLPAEVISQATSNTQWMECDDRIQNGVLAESFTCNICRRQFASQNNLHQHLLTHAQLRPFVCDICDAGFTSSVLLGSHLTTHQQEKPYMCGECGNCFAAASDFQRHVQAHLNDAS